MPNGEGFEYGQIDPRSRRSLMAWLLRQYEDLPEALRKGSEDIVGKRSTLLLKRAGYIPEQIDYLRGLYISPRELSPYKKHAENFLPQLLQYYGP